MISRLATPVHRQVSMSPPEMSQAREVSSPWQPRVFWYQRCWMTARETEAAELPSLRTHPARRMSQQSAEAGGRWSGCGVSESDVHVSGCSKIRWPFHVSSASLCSAASIWAACFFVRWGSSGLGTSTTSRARCAPPCCPAPPHAPHTPALALRRPPTPQGDAELACTMVGCPCAQNHWVRSANDFDINIVILFNQWGWIVTVFDGLGE